MWKTGICFVIQHKLYPTLDNSCPCRLSIREYVIQGFQFDTNAHIRIFLIACMQLNSVAVTFEKGRKGHIDVNMKHNFRLFPKETRRQQQKTRYRFGFVKSLNRILFSVASLHSASLSIQLWMHRFNEFSSWMCVWCVARHFAICIIISSVVTLFTLSLCQPMQSNSTSDGIAHFEMILNSERMSQLQEFLHLMRRMRLCVCKPLAIVVRNCGAIVCRVLGTRH